MVRRQLDFLSAFSLAGMTDPRQAAAWPGATLLPTRACGAGGPKQILVLDGFTPWKA